MHFIRLFKSILLSVYNLNTFIQMKSQLSKGCQPSISGVNVLWQQHSDNLPPPIQAPSKIPNLFNGSRLVVYGFVENCTQVNLKK